MADDRLKNALRDLIHANHILHYHKCVDAYGHVSIRHPLKPSVYIMCGYMAPALVSSPEDLIHYNIDDSSPVDPNAQKGYSERFIHGELFKRFPSVNCVIHSHAEEVLPFVFSSVKLKAVYHMGGFLCGRSGNTEHVKDFDIDPLYREGEARDMLVNNSRFGAGLAEMFAADPQSHEPEENVVLMRYHGFTCVAADLVTAVYRAIYTRINAEAQIRAMSISNHPGSSPEAPLGIPQYTTEGLTKEQAIGCSAMCERFQDKPWKLWIREVEVHPLYKNTLA